MPVRLLAAVLGLQVLLGVAIVVLAATDFSVFGLNDAGRPAPPSRADRFDAGRAYRDVRRQLALGPRPAGSPASRRLAEELRARLPGGRFEAVPGGLRNVVGRLPGRAPAILVAAHYDTKDLPHFVGANDGAGGVAVVLELARALGHAHRPAGAPEIRFAFFDGEESRPGHSHDELRGSRAYAARHARELKAAIVVDFVGQRDLRLTRDLGSSPALWNRLRAAARGLGEGEVFPDDTQTQVIDDHTPFLQHGVPAIDLIDFAFPCWHRPCDGLRVISRRSLDAAGESVLAMLRRAR